MSTPEDVRKLLKAYAKRTGNPRVLFRSFATFTQKYATKYAEDHPNLADLIHGGDGVLEERVHALSESGVVEIALGDGEIQSLLVADYFVDIVEQQFDRLRDRPELLFPDEASLPAGIPAESLVPVEVQTDFVNWMTGKAEGPPRVLRLDFPAGVRSILVPTTRLERELPTQCVHKLRNYLRSERNTAYINQKLQPACRGRELALKDFLTEILTRPDSVIEGIFDPSEFSFLVWTQLCQVVIKDYAEKTEKLNEEHSYCQAAYLLGYYNVFYKGRTQRTKEAEAARKNVDRRLRKSPYTYTISQIQAFTDNKGVPLTKRVSAQTIRDHIDEKLQPSGDGLAELVRFRAADNTDYFICRDYIVETALRRIYDLSGDLREHYVGLFSDLMKRYEEPDYLKDETAFRENVREEVAKRDPILAGLWRFDLLFLAASEGAPGKLPEEVGRVFHPREKRLQDLEVVLGLDQKELVRDAKLLLPFWLVVPGIKGLVRFFRRLFAGRQKDVPGTKTRTASAAPTGTARILSAPPESAASPAAGGRTAAGAAAGAARLKKAVKELEAEFVPEGQSLDGSLRELAERWNPLLDPTAKANLVEDINSLCRDFLRKMKAGFRVKPPTADRIRAMAEKLSENQVFRQIRRRDSLRRYLELYMLKLLGM